MEPRYDFSGRVVVVTGATGNLGGAIAEAFVAAQANVVLVGRDPERTAEALPSLVEREEVWVAPPTDLTDLAATQAMVEKTLERYGHVDVLANTVGGYRGGTSVHETPLETWELMMRLNARTAFIVSHAVIPPMLEQGYGKIIHTASRAALEGTRRTAAYAASKSAVVRLTETLAAELKGKGINANCVLPSTMDTPENRSAMLSADPSQWVSPSTVAQVFLFLASEAAAAIHGAAIPVFGPG
ncbi:MAG: SDR family NAD(P)-dependent oxidoreductase [Anaerolineae bacterium]